MVGLDLRFLNYLCVPLTNAKGTAACIGTVNMFASGVGGGGFAVVRTANGESRSFNFREMACKAAHQDMYHGNTPPLPKCCTKLY